MQDISDCLSSQAQNVAEARLAAKRAARAEAREIRMKELERQQKEVEERSDKDFGDRSSRPVSSLSAATLASLGGTSSRRGSGDTSISVDTEASIREIKDSLAEVEEKYKRSMVTNAQLDNEKTSLQYQVDMLREVLLEMEEELAETRRQYDEKHKECERQKHDQTVLRFQLAEMKEALEQRESLLTKHGIAPDSEDTPNGDTTSDPHVNSDSRPDPPIRVTSMGQSEDTVEKKKTISVVGQSPLSRNEQDTQVLQDASSETPLTVDARDTMKEQGPKANDSDANCNVESSLSDFGKHPDHLKEEQSHDSESKNDQKEILVENCQQRNVNQDDAKKMFSKEEETINPDCVSSAEGDIFQDAIDVFPSPSASSLLGDGHVFSVGQCKDQSEGQYHNEQEVAITKETCKADAGNEALEAAENKDHNTADITATAIEDEREMSSPDSSSKYDSGDRATDEIMSTDEEHEKACEEKVDPKEASVDVDPELQSEDNLGKNSITSCDTKERGSVVEDASTEGDIPNVDENKSGFNTSKDTQVMEVTANTGNEPSEVAEYNDHNTAAISAEVSVCNTSVEDEQETSSADSSSKYDTGDSATEETISTDEEHDKVDPKEASLDVDQGLQDKDSPGKNNSIKSCETEEESVPAEASTKGDIHNVNDETSPILEKLSQDSQVTEEEKPLADVEDDKSKVSESNLLGNNESTFDTMVKEEIHVGDNHQEQKEDTTDAGSIDTVSKGSEESEKNKNLLPDTAGTVLLDQGKDQLSHPLVRAESENPNDKAPIDSDSTKTSQSEPFSSEGESAPEGDEWDDDDDGAVRSEKYTGESLSLGSSVDRSSMDDIRMEDSSDKALRKGKGKNKEDCVVS